MKAGNLINIPVIAADTGKSLGMIKDVRVACNEVVMLVLSTGGIFSKGQYLIPENIGLREYDHIEVDSASTLHQCTAKEMKRVLADSYSAIGQPVLDNDDIPFGKIANMILSEDFKVMHYEISRSFFDDLDYGYGLIVPEKLTMTEKGFKFDGEAYEAGNDVSGGIVKKVLGEED